jgi:flagellar FliJ protein
MFKFVLQPLLDFRRRIEEKVLIEYAGRVRRFEREKERLERLRNEKSLLARRFSDMQRGVMKAGDIAALFDYLGRVNVEERSQEEVVRKAAEELEEKRRDLLEAVKKRKAIEVLKDRQREAYRQGLARKEIRRLDEFGIDQYKRNEGKEGHHRL